jgi:hypothetical protein
MYSLAVWCARVLNSMNYDLNLPAYLLSFVVVVTSAEALVSM